MRASKGKIVTRHDAITSGVRGVRAREPDLTEAWQRVVRRASAGGQA